MWITTLISTIGTAIGSLFGFKKAQADVVKGAIESISTAATADEEYAAAAARAVSSVYEHGNFLERSWRPAAMWVFLGLIVGRFFGYVPPGLSEEEVSSIYRFFEIGLIGYMPLRSLDKWMKGFQVGSILKEFIKKKIV